MKKATRVIISLIVALIGISIIGVIVYFNLKDDSSKPPVNSISQVEQDFIESINSGSAVVETESTTLVLPAGVNVNASDVSNITNEYIVATISGRTEIIRRGDTPELITWPSGVVFDTVLEIKGDYALVENGSNNPFIINLATDTAEDKVVIGGLTITSYTVDGENFKGYQFAGNYFILLNCAVSGSEDAEYFVKVISLADGETKLDLFSRGEVGAILNFKASDNFLILEGTQETRVYSMQNFVLIKDTNNQAFTNTITIPVLSSEPYDYLIGGEHYAVTKSHVIHELSASKLFIEVFEASIQSESEFLYSFGYNSYGGDNDGDRFVTQKCYILNTANNTKQEFESNNGYVTCGENSISGFALILNTQAATDKKLNNSTRIATYYQVSDFKRVVSYNYYKYGPIIGTFSNKYVCSGVGLGTGAVLKKDGNLAFALPASTVILNQNVSGNYVIVKSLGYFGLLDLDGNRILNSEYSKISNVIGNYCIVTGSLGTYYRHNLLTGEETQIDNMFADFETNLFNGVDYYVTYSSGVYSIYNFEGTLLIGNLSETNFKLLNLDDGLKTVYLKNDKIEYYSAKSAQNSAQTVAQKAGAISSNPTVVQAFALPTLVNNTSATPVADLNTGSGTVSTMDSTAISSNYSRSINVDEEIVLSTIIEKGVAISSTGYTAEDVAKIGAEDIINKERVEQLFIDENIEINLIADGKLIGYGVFAGTESYVLKPCYDLKFSIEVKIKKEGYGIGLFEFGTASIRPFAAMMVDIKLLKNNDNHEDLYSTFYNENYTTFIMESEMGSVDLDFKTSDYYNNQFLTNLDSYYFGEYKPTGYAYDGIYGKDSDSNQNAISYYYDCLANYYYTYESKIDISYNFEISPILIGENKFRVNKDGTHTDTSLLDSLKNVVDTKYSPDNLQTTLVAKDGLLIKLFDMYGNDMNSGEAPTNKIIVGKNTNYTAGNYKLRIVEAYSDIRFWDEINNDSGGQDEKVDLVKYVLEDGNKASLDNPQMFLWDGSNYKLPTTGELESFISTNFVKRAGEYYYRVYSGGTMVIRGDISENYYNIDGGGQYGLIDNIKVKDRFAFTFKKPGYEVDGLRYSRVEKSADYLDAYYTPLNSIYTLDIKGGLTAVANASYFSKENVKIGYITKSGVDYPLVSEMVNHVVKSGKIATIENLVSIYPIWQIFYNDKTNVKVSFNIGNNAAFNKEVPFLHNNNTNFSIGLNLSWAEKDYSLYFITEEDDYAAEVEDWVVEYYKADKTIDKYSFLANNLMTATEINTYIAANKDTKTAEEINAALADKYSVIKNSNNQLDILLNGNVNIVNSDSTETLNNLKVKAVKSAGTVKYKQQLTNLPQANRYGYEFVGWERMVYDQTQQKLVASYTDNIYTNVNELEREFLLTVDGLGSHNSDYNNDCNECFYRAVWRLKEIRVSIKYESAMFAFEGNNFSFDSNLWPEQASNNGTMIFTGTFTVEDEITTQKLINTNYQAMDYWASNIVDSTDGPDGSYVNVNYIDIIEHSSGVKVQKSYNYNKLYNFSLLEMLKRINIEEKEQLTYNKGSNNIYFTDSCPYFDAEEQITKQHLENGYSISNLVLMADVNKVNFLTDLIVTSEDNRAKDIILNGSYSKIVVEGDKTTITPLSVSAKKLEEGETLLSRYNNGLGYMASTVSSGKLELKNFVLPDGYLNYHVNEIQLKLYTADNKYAIITYETQWSNNKYFSTNIKSINYDHCDIDGTNADAAKLELANLLGYTNADELNTLFTFEGYNINLNINKLTTCTCVNADDNEDFLFMADTATPTTLTYKNIFASGVLAYKSAEVTFNIIENEYNIILTASDDKNFDVDNSEDAALKARLLEMANTDEHQDWMFTANSGPSKSDACGSVIYGNSIDTSKTNGFAKIKLKSTTNGDVLSIICGGAPYDNTNNKTYTHFLNYILIQGLETKTYEKDGDTEKSTYDKTVGDLYKQDIGIAFTIQLTDEKLLVINNLKTGTVMLCPYDDINDNVFVIGSHTLKVVATPVDGYAEQFSFNITLTLNTVEGSKFESDIIVSSFFKEYKGMSHNINLEVDDETVTNKDEQDKYLASDVTEFDVASNQFIIGIKPYTILLDGHGKAITVGDGVDSYPVNDNKFYINEAIYKINYNAAGVITSVSTNAKNASETNTIVFNKVDGYYLKQLIIKDVQYNDIGYITAFPYYSANARGIVYNYRFYYLNDLTQSPYYLNTKDGVKSLTTISSNIDITPNGTVGVFSSSELPKITLALHGYYREVNITAKYESLTVIKVNNPINKNTIALNGLDYEIKYNQEYTVTNNKFTKGLNTYTILTSGGVATSVSDGVNTFAVTGNEFTIGDPTYGIKYTINYTLGVITSVLQNAKFTWGQTSVNMDNLFKSYPTDFAALVPPYLLESADAFPIFGDYYYYNETDNYAIYYLLKDKIKTVDVNIPERYLSQEFTSIEKINGKPIAETGLNGIKPINNFIEITLKPNLNKVTINTDLGFYNDAGEWQSYRNIEYYNDTNYNNLLLNRLSNFAFGYWGKDKNPLTEEWNTVSSKVNGLDNSNLKTVELTVFHNTGVHFTYTITGMYDRVEVIDSALNVVAKYTKNTQIDEIVFDKFEDDTMYTLRFVAAEFALKFDANKPASGVDEDAEITPSYLVDEENYEVPYTISVYYDWIIPENIFPDKTEVKLTGFDFNGWTKTGLEGKILISDQDRNITPTPIDNTEESGAWVAGAIDTNADGKLDTITVKGWWSRKKVKVTFNLNDSGSGYGTSPATRDGLAEIEYEYNNNMGSQLVPTASRFGYDFYTKNSAFIGWQTKPGKIDEAAALNAMSSLNQNLAAVVNGQYVLTVYAMWQPKTYTIQYLKAWAEWTGTGFVLGTAEYIRGLAGTKIENGVITYPEGSLVYGEGVGYVIEFDDELPGVETPECKGYDFLGYYVDKKYDNDNYAVNSSTLLNYDRLKEGSSNNFDSNTDKVVTIYPKWQLQGILITLVTTYESSDSNEYKILSTISAGNQEFLTGGKVQPLGYLNFDANGGNNGVHSCGTDGMLAFSQIKGGTDDGIRYHVKVDYGASVGSSVVYANGEFEAPTATGYNFEGYYYYDTTAATPTFAKYIAENCTLERGWDIEMKKDKTTGKHIPIVLYAKWTIKTFNVNLNINADDLNLLDAETGVNGIQLSSPLSLTATHYSITKVRNSSDLTVITDIRDDGTSITLDKDNQPISVQLKFYDKLVIMVTTPTGHYLAKITGDGSKSYTPVEDGGNRVFKSGSTYEKTTPAGSLDKIALSYSPYYDYNSDKNAVEKFKQDVTMNFAHIYSAYNLTLDFNIFMFNVNVHNMIHDERAGTVSESNVESTIKEFASVYDVGWVVGLGGEYSNDSTYYKDSSCTIKYETAPSGTIFGDVNVYRKYKWNTKDQVKVTFYEWTGNGYVELDTGLEYYYSITNNDGTVAYHNNTWGTGIIGMDANCKYLKLPVPTSYYWPDMIYGLTGIKFVKWVAMSVTPTDIITPYELATDYLNKYTDIAVGKEYNSDAKIYPVFDSYLRELNTEFSYSGQAVLDNYYFLDGKTAVDITFADNEESRIAVNKIKTTVFGNGKDLSKYVSFDPLYYDTDGNPVAASTLNKMHLKLTNQIIEQIFGVGTGGLTINIEFNIVDIDGEEYKAQTSVQVNYNALNVRVVTDPAAALDFSNYSGLDGSYYYGGTYYYGIEIQIYNSINPEITLMSAFVTNEQTVEFTLYSDGIEAKVTINYHKGLIDGNVISWETDGPHEVGSDAGLSEAEIAAIKSAYENDGWSFGISDGTMFISRTIEVVHEYQYYSVNPTIENEYRYYITQQPEE